MTIYGTSELGYRVRHEPSTVFNADDRPVGNRASRDILANGLNFYADIYGQQRMSFAARSMGPAKNPYFGTNRTPWTQVAASGAFPIAIRENGESYKMRVALAGCIENVAAKAQFAFVLAPVIDALAILESTTTIRTDSVWVSLETASVTPAYLTGASKGANAWVRMVGLSALEASAYLVATGTPVDIGGDSGGVAQCLVNLVVFAKTDNATYQARLYNASGQEWPGS